MGDEMMAALVGAISGFIFGWIPFFFERYNKLKGCFLALIAETRSCTEMAKIYKNDNIACPLYRLPIIAWQHAYPKLLEEGTLSEKEVTELQNFYSEVETINRGLDQVGKGRETNNETQINEEKNRILIKIKNLEQKYERIRNIHFPYQSFCKYFKKVITSIF